MVYEILSTVLYHELKELGMGVTLCGKPWRGTCSGYPMYRVVSREKLPHLLIKLLSRISLWGRGTNEGGKLVVYYESINRELKTIPIYECRCDERLKTKTEESTRLVYTHQQKSLFIMNR